MADAWTALSRFGCPHFNLVKWLLDTIRNSLLTHNFNNSPSPTTSTWIIGGRWWNVLRRSSRTQSIKPGTPNGSSGTLWPYTDRHFRIDFNPRHTFGLGLSEHQSKAIGTLRTHLQLCAECRDLILEKKSTIYTNVSPTFHFCEHLHIFHSNDTFFEVFVTPCTPNMSNLIWIQPRYISTAFPKHLSKFKPTIQANMLLTDIWRQNEFSND